MTTVWPLAEDQAIARGACSPRSCAKQIVSDLNAGHGGKALTQQRN